VSEILRLNGLEFKSISKIKFPRLAWSNRKIEEYEMSKKSIL
jgi:hypothetical protein